MGMATDHVDHDVKIRDHHHAGCSGQDCQDDCRLIETERTRYFHGKFMTPRDFRQEQAYLLGRQRLHNRALHGWGVVCGLGVTRHPGKGCEGRVIVQSGLAIDCCGRELILEENLTFDLGLPVPADSDPESPAPDRKQSSRRGSASDDEVETPVERRWLCLRYQEELIEWLPALYAGGEGCDPNHREANRVREIAVLELCPDLPPGCWPDDLESPDAPCRDECAEDGSASCLRPDCVCGNVVPIALITFDPADPLDFHIDTRNRRQLPKSAEHLTHIVGINWPHGGQVDLAELRSWGGRLEVRFDRKIEGPEGNKRGVSHFTLMVQYGGIQRDVEFLPADHDHPPQLEDDCLAVFTIDPGYLGVEDNIAGNDVFVTLKCDFIIDCLGQAVDGNHLRGELPSGDGAPGGTFESWFRVVAEGGNARRGGTAS
jgi:hypothetical protein